MTKKEKWETLYQAHYDQVLSYLTAKVDSRETAEDLCMDVFERAYRSFRSFDETRASFVTWLFAITRHRLTDYYRTLHTTEPLKQESIHSRLTAPNDPEILLMREETLSRLASALRAMEQEEQAVVVLRYERGWTLTEIAERTGISYGMVKVRHRAALNKLRRALEA